VKGEFQCLNVRDGKLVWRTNFVTDFGAIYIGEKGTAPGASRHGATGAPIIDGNNVIAQVGSANGASIVAFDKASGKVVWKSQNDQTAYAAPIIAEVAGVRTFIAFTIEGVIGLDPRDGKLLWRRELHTRLGRHVTTPVVIGDVVIVASHQLGLVGTQIVREGAGFVAKEAWLDKEIQTNFSSPVTVGDFLYGVGSKKDVICVNGKTGEIAWQKTGLLSTDAGKAEATFLVMGGNVAMLTDGGQFILFAAEPKAYRELSRTQVCGTNWCNPAYVGGKLFVRDNRELRCVELMK
jgi:outer membrane protein assembly factor BamB